MSEGRLVAVTGATGFIGGHLLPELERNGFRLRVLTRSVRRVVVDTVHLPDLADRGRVRAGLEGAYAVVHLAGRAHVLREDVADVAAVFAAANVAPAAALAAAAAEAGVERFVLMSSAGAVTTSSPFPLDDDSIPNPDTPYGRSKLQAELRARAAIEAARSALALLCLRPALVYGPAMKGNPLRLWSLVARRVPIPVGSANNRRSFLYVGNLTAAIIRALVAESAPAGAFFVTDSVPVSTADFVARIAAALGVRPRTPSVPMPLLRALARTGDFIPGMPLDSVALDRLTGSLELSGNRFARAVGFEPRYTMDEGVRLASEWFSHHREATR